MTTGKASILVVEDNAVVAMEIFQRLTNTGYNVLGPISTGEEAVETALREQPDLILMDIRLGGEIDGVEAVKKIEEDADIPVIYLTAMTDESSLSHVKSTQPFGYIIKPFDGKELHFAIQMALYKYQMEKKLKESEQWLYTTLNSIGDAVITVDTDNIIKFVNPAAEQTTGWMRSEIIGRNAGEFFKHLLGNKETSFLKDFNDVLFNGSSNISDQYNLLIKNGKDMPIQSNIAPIKDALGKISGAVWVFHDITEGRKALETLAESEKKYRQLTEEAVDIIFTTDIDGYFIYSNNAGMKSSGYSIEELRQKNYLDLVLPEFKRKMMRFYLKQLRSKLTTSYIEYPFLTKEGLAKWYGQNSTLIFENNKVIGFHFIARDITERKKMEEQSLLLANAVESTSDIISITNLQNKFTFVNKAFLNTYGLKQEDVLGKEPDIIISDNNRAEPNVILASASKGGWRGEILNKRQDGSEFPIMLNTSQVKDPEGRVLGLMGIARDISDQKKTEARLNKLSQEFMTLAENAPDVIMRFNKNLKLSYVNRAIEKSVGIKVDRLKNKTFEEAGVPESIWRNWQDSISIVFDTGEELNVEISAPFEGEKKFFESRMAPEFDESGNVESVLVISRDITGRKKADESLRESEKRFRKILENMSLVSVILDVNGKIAFCNDFLLSITGWTRKEILGKDWFDNLIPADHRNEIKSVFLNVIKGNKKASYNTNEILTKDGGRRFISWNTTLLKDSSGDIIGLTSIGEDITEKRITENELRETNAVLSAVFKASPLAIHTIDLNGIMKSWNPASERMFGWKESETVGRLNPIIPEEKKSEYRHLRDKLSEDEARAGIELRRMKKDGSYLDIRLFSAPLKDSAGNIFGGMALMEDITDKKKAENELRKLSQAVKQSPASIVITNVNGIIEYVNPRFTSVTGYTPEEAIGQNPRILKSGEKPPQEYKILWQTILSGEEWRGEFHNMKKSGELFWESASISPIKNEKGETTHFLAVKEDISAQKEALGKLAESEERYRSLFEFNTAVMILIEPKEAVIKGANQAACSFYGYKKEELVGMNIAQINTLPQDEIFERIEQVVKNKTDHLFFRHKLASGEIRDVELHVGGIKINGEDLLYAIIHDITERRIAEMEVDEYRNRLENLVEKRTSKLKKVNRLLKREIEKLRLADEKILGQIYFLRTLINTIPIPVFIKDHNMVYTDCNRMFENFFGIKKIDLIGKTTIELLPPDVTKLQEDLDKELLNDPGEHMYEVTISTRRNTVHDVIVYKATYKRGDGTIGGIVGVMLDITPQKKMQNEIKVALEKEKELNEMKSRFISTASHEFRTPLTSILVSSDLLEMYGKNWPEEKFLEHVEKIQKGVQYMTELLDDVLTMSRAENKNQKYNPSNVNLYELCRIIVEESKVTAKEIHKITFDYSAEDKAFSLDPKLLKYVLANLLSNAIKYSPLGGRINLKVEMEEEALLFSVTDEGIGIPEDDLNIIFEPFHRGNNIGTIAGTGLGMSIIKKSVEEQGGTIDVISELNKGSRFTVKLPVKHQ